MHVGKKNRLQFYSELKNNFPELAKMNFWNEHDYEEDPVASAGIMTEIGEAVINWALQGDIDKIKDFMKFFEESYKTYSDEATSYIYTDFLPTIISMNSTEHRKIIKAKILPETMKRYNQLLNLGLYAEK